MSRRFLTALLVLEVFLAASCGSSSPVDAPAVAPRFLHIRNARLYESEANSSSPAMSFAGLVKIVNHGTATSRFGLGIKGFIFQNSRELLSYIASIPAIYPNEPNYQKAWRFLTARAYVYTPFTGDVQNYDPLLFVNSVGYGYCDSFANVLATIWQWQGYQSRVWYLSGHVVPEIQVNGRWMMFDAMFGVYYLDNDNEIASVDELSQDPNLILHPVNPIYEPSNEAYWENLAGFYSSIENNWSMPPQGAESRGMQVTLPAKSELIFPVRSDPKTFLSGGSLPSTPLYYLAQIQIPEVDSDVYLELPLFMVGASGSGEIEVAGQTYTLGSAELAAFFAQFANDEYPKPVTAVLLRAGATHVVVSMALSAYAVDGLKEPNVRISPYNRGTTLDTIDRSLDITYSRTLDYTPAAVTDLLSGVGAQLLQLPYKYISPVYVAPQVVNLMNQSSVVGSEGDRAITYAKPRGEQPQTVSAERYSHPAIPLSIPGEITLGSSRTKSLSAGM